MSICVYDSLPDEAVEIRENVFVKEQGFEKEFDEIDEKAIHLVMFDEHLQKPVATCRVYNNVVTDCKYRSLSTISNLKLFENT